MRHDPPTITLAEIFRHITDALLDIEALRDAGGEPLIAINIQRPPAMTPQSFRHWIREAPGWALDPDDPDGASWYLGPIR